jgi:hypothetical protein
MKKFVDVGAPGGDVRVLEDEVASITNADLKKHLGGISRADLERAFAEGKELMKERGLKPGGRIRPVVDQLRDRSWFVVLVEH